MDIWNDFEMHMDWRMESMWNEFGVDIEGYEY